MGLCVLRRYITTKQSLFLCLKSLLAPILLTSDVVAKEPHPLNIKTPRYKNSIPKEEVTVAIAFDSTGLKRYGRDEWHQEKHKVSSKRSWRKMHLGVGDNHIIHAAHLTDKDTMDDGVMKELCDQIDVNVSQTSADMMYDENHVYETIEAHFPEADIAIPPKDKLIYDERHHPKVCANLTHVLPH